MLLPEPLLELSEPPVAGRALGAAVTAAGADCPGASDAAAVGASGVGGGSAVASVSSV